MFNAHQFTSSRALEMLESGEMSDCVIEVQEEQTIIGTEFNVHKLVLTVNSDVFRAMFSHKNTKECQESRIIIKDFTANCVHQMLVYMYTGTLKEEQYEVETDAVPLMQIAHKYQIKSLVQLIEQELTKSLSLENVFDRVEMADLYQMNKLYSACGQFIRCHLKTVKKDAKWLELKKKLRELAFAILEEFAEEFEQRNIFKTTSNKMSTGQSNIKSRALEMFQSGEGADCVVEMVPQSDGQDKQEFNVHKYVLMVNSDVFMAVFSHENTTEAREGRIQITDSTGTAVRQMLIYMYTGALPKEYAVETDAGPLMHLANKYQIKALIQLIEQELESRNTNGESNEEKEDSLLVHISEALSERDKKVKYTLHTKTTLPEFAKRDWSIVREHEEFIWLHNCLEDCEDYAGFIIPPAPPRPEFDLSREKLEKLRVGEATMPWDEYAKMKEELEEEYLVQFKKSVAMHEYFVCRLVSHPIFQKDPNFRRFLEYENELGVRTPNKKQLVGTFFKRLTQSADEVLLSGQYDLDGFFEREKNYLIEYYTHIKEATRRSDKVCRLRQNLANTYTEIAHGLEKFAKMEASGGEREFGRFLIKFTEVLEELKKTEARKGTDVELKETDTFCYFMRESQAAKDFLCRRMRCLANYEAANQLLKRCNLRNTDIQGLYLKSLAETEQKEACKKFNEFSKQARGELIEWKKIRVAAFKKNLSELAELEIKQSKAKISILQTAIRALNSEKTATLSHGFSGDSRSTQLSGASSSAI